MKITLSQLKQAIIEEYRAATGRGSPVRESKIDRMKLFKIIVAYDNDPTRMVPHKLLSSAGLAVDTKLSYHVVYGQIVGQKEGVDVEYWLDEEGRWEEIDDVERHHPVSVHRP
jgi:hypothetical protein